MAVKLRKQNLTYKDGITKIKFKIDKNFVNMVITYLFTKSKAITKSNLISMRKLFSIMDIDMYMTNAEIYSRLIFIQKALECILSQGTERKEIIIDYCKLENDIETEKIISDIDRFGSLTLSEIKMVNKSIADRLKYAYLVHFKEVMSDVFLRMDQGIYKSYAEANNYIKDIVGSFINDARKAENNSTMNAFTLRGDCCDMFFRELYDSVTDPDAIYKTGIRRLNEMLSPGFMPGRLYLFLGLTGGYKSSMLLQCARWIKLYNKVTPRRKEPSATPTVLLITTENSVEETFIRLFNMSVDDKPINEWEFDDALKAFKTTGKMVLKDGGIDIYIAYYANNELSTADLYGVIEDLEDDNREIIALIFDYIKRIRPAEKAPDERLQLKNSSNELKTLAVRLNIPVITANQINRAGNMAIDAAAGEGKEDLARLIGRANIAVSWDLLENVDWAAIINMEREKRENLLYLTIKRIKIRYKDMATYSYINHPFVPGSTIRLQDDLFGDYLSKESLASNMEGVRGIGQKGNISSGKRNIESFPEKETSIFDIDKAINGNLR